MHGSNEGAAGRPASTARTSGPHATAVALLQRVLAEPAALPAYAPAEIDLVLRLARRGGVVGRLAHWLEASGAEAELPRAAREQLESARIVVGARQRVTLWELDRLETVLHREPAFRIVVLKGCAYLLCGLPNSRGRDFSDVDLLFPRRELPEVERRLVRHGWRATKLSAYDQRYYRAWSHELPPLVHVEREVETDLHHNILPPTARLTPDADLLNRDIVKIPGRELYRLADVDLVLHAIVHLFFDSAMDDKLRELVDIDQLLRHFSSVDTTFWDRLHDRATALDLLRPAFYALRYARRWLACPVPDGAARRFASAAPVSVILRLMDFAVPRALFPQHPDAPSMAATAARALLYARSHWIRMPPWLLMRHLAYKLWLTRVRPGRIA